MAVADDLGVDSIAFPAISTGVYGYPPDLAARVAVDTIRATATNVRVVRLIAFNRTTADPLRAALAQT